MICGRRESLIRLYDGYVKEYTEAVTTLGGISRKIAQDDWKLSWDLAERAGRKSAEILMQLKRHKEEHGC